MDGGIGALILMMPWKRSGFSGSSCSMSAYGSVASNAASCLSRSSMCSLARSILRSTPVRSVGTHASLRRQRGLLRAVQRDRQLGEDREVRVKAHTLDPSHPQGSEAPFVLQPPEGSLYRRAAPVEAFEAQSLARDEGVQTVGLDPHRRGLALAGRAPPLGRVPLVVGSGKAPLAVLAAGRLDDVGTGAFGCPTSWQAEECPHEWGHGSLKGYATRCRGTGGSRDRSGCSSGNGTSTTRCAGHSPRADRYRSTDRH